MRKGETKAVRAAIENRPSGKKPRSITRKRRGKPRLKVAEDRSENIRDRERRKVVTVVANTLGES